MRYFENCNCICKKFGSGKATYDVLKGKKFPYKDSTFDACICLDVMEHVPDVNFFEGDKTDSQTKWKVFLLVPCENQPMTYTWLFPKIGFGRLTFKHWGHVHPGVYSCISSYYVEKARVSCE